MANSRLHDFSGFVNFLVIAMTMTASIVTSFPNGAPNYSCRNMIPGHNNGTQTSPPPYRVDVSKTVLQAGERTRVTVESTGDFPFLGFICAASDSDDFNNNTVGTMAHALEFQERDLLTPITCTRSSPNTTMTHTSRRAKFRVEFDWSPPFDAVPGQGYKMRCTVVQSFFRCWTGIQVDLVIGQSSTSNPSTSGGTPNGSGNNNPSTGNNAVSGNDVNAFPNNAFVVPRQNPNTQPTNTDTSRFSPITNSNPNQFSGFQPASFQNQDSGLAAGGGFNQQITRSSAPTRNRNAFVLPPPAQENDIMFQGQGQNEILLPTQNIDLALLIELINMGFDPFQNVDVNFNSISNPDINTNTIMNDRGRFDQVPSPSRPIPFSQQSPRGFELQLSADVNVDRQPQRSRMRSGRGPNSRGLFQSPNARPLNRNFSRIRQPHFQERPRNFNNV